jgi:phosphoenolpyruvate---glycerone phosphotransferase subunit DhaK
MKKLLNDTSCILVESLRGLKAAHPELLNVSLDPPFITRAGGPTPGKVGVLSGGGSGHEPLHGGYVGVGMLDAACPGQVFTSPTPDQIEAATRAIQTGAGVLHIVKNYSGDVMNFEMAAELVQADGIAVDAVVIDDDVAVKDSVYTQGRRGVGATVFAEKVTGAAAEAGYDLPAVKAVALKVKRHGRSMGVALTSCTVPAKGSPTFELGEREIEVGIGIHGEPGRERGPARPAREVASLLVEATAQDLGLVAGDDVFVMVNGMGGTPLIELYVLYNDVHELLSKRSIHPSRRLVGNFITSLDMQGASLTLVKLDAELTRLYDAPVHTAALRWGR